MERVAFLVDESGIRIDCLLNPQTVQVTRVAGVRPRGSADGQLTGVGLADDPLVFTGGGRTELVLDLLFDTDLVEGPTPPEDVRTLTRPLWMLAENSAVAHGWQRPPLVRLVWGKTWNVPGVVVAVAERFDVFTRTGSPRRSWLRLKLLRVAESADEAQQGFAEELAAASTPGIGVGQAVVATGDGSAAPGYSGVRFDLLAHDALGSPLRWRLLAEHNRITDPFTVPAGTALAVPPPTGTDPTAVTNSTAVTGSVAALGMLTGTGLLTGTGPWTGGDLFAGPGPAGVDRGAR
ncbi:hypothetical protein ACQP1S_17535 [Micromonospora matsumotoense]|uniref:CIS tube protein n=1 Tax=Micromonospora matsumotoense TaxID=121616 RepID=UPI003D8B629F